MEYIKAFIVGGLICVVAQVLIDKTKLSSGKTVVLFVVVGCVLGGFGIYDYLVDFAGAGATVPVIGFGNALANGVKKAVDEKGFVGIFTGGFNSMSAGVTVALVFSSLAGFLVNPKEK